jgi:hypothetical protein
MKMALPTSIAAASTIIVATASFFLMLPDITHLLGQLVKHPSLDDLKRLKGKPRLEAINAP